ncbi:MAG: PIG-L family deacetylase [Dehalococcoidia bacterium]|nr:PIG-L family deacetylase [Dehalococcoidia bacterium]
MDETPGRVLVVIPHPDDAEGWCGGTVAAWVKGGARVVYVLCTDGSKGTDDPEMSPQRLAQIREKEQLEAASVLGVEDVVLLRHADGELEDTYEFRRELVRAIRLHRPDVILCPDPYRRKSHWHRDHRIAGQVAADAAFPYARDHLHFQELYRDEGLETHKAGTILFWAPDTPDTHIDIGGHIDTKARALVCHQSQNPGRTVEQAAEGISQRARLSAAGSQVEYAEAFRKVEFRR